MKLRFSTCILMLTLGANGAAALTSAAVPDAIDVNFDTRPVDVRTAPLPDADHAGPGQPSPAVPAAPLTRSANPLWAVPLRVLSSTRDRPIFSASRRPPSVAAAPVAAPTVATAPKPKEPERPPLSLVGTIARGIERFGIFLNQSTALRLKVGEDFQGWKLSSVEGREATLEKDKEVVVLTLPQPGSASSAQASHPYPGQPPMPGQLLSQPQPRRRLGQPNRQM